ncbi:MAG: hypothetical protein IH991_02755 [Planctomycetes bacterium]|nr:hypothetical protein [Planctomycetota bacterium]
MIKKNASSDSIKPDQVLEAVHELMHGFDPENHRYISTTQSDGASARGLDLYGEPQDTMSEMECGVITFGPERVELEISPESRLLTCFRYDDPCLLRNIADALAQVGVHVPADLSSVIDDLQEELNGC